MSLIEQLAKIGFSPLERTLYATICEERPLLMADLAKISGINRSNCVYGIQRLQERGLVSLRVQGKRKYIDIVDPAHAFAGLREAEEQRHTRQEKALVDLQRIVPSGRTTSGLQTLSGPSGLRHVLVEFIAQKQDIYWIGSLPTLFSALSEDDVRMLVTLPRMQGTTTVYHLTDKTSLGYPKYLEKIGKLREVRFLHGRLPKDCILGWTGQKLVIVTVAHRRIAISLMDDAVSIGMFATLFAMLWQNAEPM